VVLFCKSQSEIKLDDIYVYAMKDSAFMNPDTRIVLHNGGPFRSKWPNLYKALKGKTITDRIITLQDIDKEYLLVVLDPASSSVMFNLNTGQIDADLKTEN